MRKIQQRKSFAIKFFGFEVKMQKKDVAINLIVSAVTQIITLAIGLFLPRLILLAWGSEYNGLLSSVTNIMSYLALLEAGLNTAILQALYKTVGKNDREQTSIVVRTAQRYYYKISIVYAAMVVGIALLYPLIVRTAISYLEIVAIIVLQGLVGVINFAFRAAYQQLLNAEGKYYVISLITFLTTVLTYSAKIAAIKIFDSVIIMQIMSVFIIIIQVAIYAVYFSKHYKWINKNAQSDESLIENRKYYFIQQIAGLIFNSTDTIVLSIFCGLKVASVYAVYNLVYNALALVIALIRGSTHFVLGQSFHKDSRLFTKVYDAYSAMQSMTGGIMASISIVMIINFIKIYTDGVTDIDYIDFFAAFLFSLNLMLECSRGASLASANIAGKAPETTWRYIMEAAINLFSSLILVNFIGMKGVLLGTTLAGLYRTTDSIYYTNKHVLKRSPFGEFKNVGVDFMIYFLVAFASFSIINLNTSSYFVWFGYAIITGIIVVSIYAGAFIMLNKHEAKVLLDTLKRH